MRLMKKIPLILLTLILIFPLFAVKGKVYLVPGSDTSIWDGLSTSVYDGRLFLSGLYSNPGRYGYAVMDTAFRHSLKDSQGRPMKMTWWMMAGNVFDRSINCNIPVRRNISLYLMKKYHQEAIDHYDDQLSLHYHTYYWSDPDGDGIYAYEVAPDFSLKQDDYEKTLCSFLIEDRIFPVSFRSGWMYMDLNWQAYQERFIPFDMSDCWSAWSEGTQPYHPAEDNYRIPGDLKQWRVRSFYFTVYSQMTNALNTMFREAAEGKDQMANMWSHLPETDFLAGMDSMNTLAHQLSEQYGVEFLYCKDVEAMRLWINPEDTIAPVLTFTEIPEGDQLRFAISSDGPVFQSDEPFVAMKDIYEDYYRLACIKTGEFNWETRDPVPAAELVKVSVAVCDSVGNQSIEELQYLPDDIYIDNADPEFHEREGNWSDHNSGELWNLGARLLNGRGKVEIIPDIPETRDYAIFFHGAGSDTDSLRLIVQNGSISDTLHFYERLKGLNHWQRAGFAELEAGSGNTLIFENLSREKKFGLDVVRITPMVADKFFDVKPNILNFDAVSVEDTVFLELKISNFGKDPLQVISFSFNGEKLMIPESFPLNLDPMEERSIPVYFSTQEFCEYQDAITICTDDPHKPEIIIPVFVSADSYFKAIDNEDADKYTEYGSGWSYSTALGWRSTSRYTTLTGSGAATGKYAEFREKLNYSGSYDIQYIVPRTTNAHDHAQYILMINGEAVDTVIINQNEESGVFRSIGHFDLPKDLPISLRVMDNGGNTNSGAVLRTDAVKFLLLEEKVVSAIDFSGIPDKFMVYPNYPNPFNPSTSITFALPEAGEVRIDFFDLQGRKAGPTIREYRKAGYHRILWVPRELSSGVYFYRIQTPDASEIRKCTLMK